MNEAQFRAIMPVVCDELAAMIAEKQAISEEKAINLLYRSKLYEALEDENTKVWHYSTQMLYALLEEELKTGTIVFPDV